MADRLLFLSYAFPPLAAPESLLAAKAVHSLHGWEIDVISATPAIWQRTDADLVVWAEAGAARVERIAAPFWLPAVQPLRATRRYPDAMRFLRRATMEAVRRLGLAQYDAMVTWSQWHSVHLAGLEIAASRPGLPWLAHFSDPWVDNPMVPLRGLAARLAARWEDQVVRTASALEFTASTTAERTMARYPDVPADKAHVVPHLFDPALYPARESTGSDAIVIRHVGSFYASRRPDVLVASVARLLEGRPDLVGRLRLELIGPLPRSMRSILTGSALPEGCLRWIPRVSYRESLALMVQADLVVVVDPPATRSVFLASKVVDYLGSGTPILALVPPGAAAEVVSGMGGWVADPTDVGAATAALAAAVSEVERPRAGPWGDPNVRDRYAEPAVGAQRDRLLREIVGGGC